MSDRRILIEGRPGTGKTTLVRRLVETLRAEGLTPQGFTTEELRDDRRRVGFAVEAIAGERAVLAHVELPGPPRVGRYGVDLEAFERVALPVLKSRGAGVVIIDELGKMELASQRFRDAVLKLISGDASIVATVHAFRDPFTEGLKRRDDVSLIKLSRGNRDAVLDSLIDALI